MRPVGGESDRWTRNLAGEKEQLGSPVVVKVNKPNPFGAARPREEVLTEKGVDWKKLDEEIEVKKVGGISRPNSSQSSRPGSSQSVRSDGAVLLQNQPQEGAVDVPAVKPKPKVNPFGDAKPREVLLAEKGLDWRKIDLELEHKRIDRPETDEEKNLREEIENLKKDSLHKSGEEQSNLNDEIMKKEKDLELLMLELDNKVRFGPKNIDRPGSGSGRYTGPAARVSSQPGPAEEPRGAAEFMDRPRSRGIVESRPRQNDDRRNFSGGRDRGGFLGSREQDRSIPRNRW
ncbi:hypothetical protein Leryth_020727 [Lithospermum erythrorhizon]|nr:hypothetical protein Leryth_020727 [Lithospermum erythrorhizon]